MLAIADQGIFAGSHFLLNILLAHWLSPSEYGAFAIAYSVLLLLLIIHNALFIAPMLVFGAAKYRDCFPEYLGILLRQHFAFMIPVSGLLSTASLIVYRFSSPATGKALFAMAVTAPILVLLWLLRRALYVRLCPEWAAVSGVLYLALVLGGALTLRSLNRLSPVTGLLALGAGSFFVCMFLVIRIRPQLTRESKNPSEIRIDHWQYGKWLLASAGPSWVYDQIYFVALPAWAGLDQAGALKAILNLAMPALQTISALGVLLTPLLVRERNARGLPGMFKVMMLSLGLFGAFCTAYLVVLWTFRTQLPHILYGNKYGDLALETVLLLGLLTVVQSISIVFGAGLAALEKSKLLFIASSVGCLVALVIGIPLTATLAIRGSLCGLLASHISIGALMFLFMVRNMRYGERS